VPDYVIRGGNTYRIFSDHLGSPRVVVNVANAADRPLVVDYDAFGNLESGAVGASFLPMGFAGGHWDGEVGLVRFGARDYDPATGRYTAKDPLLFESGEGNLYSFFGSDPVNQSARSGERSR
ncbi:MAG TPA: RHS repeat-associated core domain-containing protein, partial [Polyangiales bacterium]